MARNRQRAKQRQAERRAARLESRRADASVDEEALEQAELASGAPPSDLGFSDATLEAEEEADAAEADLEAEELDADDIVAAEEALEDEALEDEAQPERRRARSDGAPAHGRRRHNRLIGFLIAVVAELRRVEWPDRQTLTMLTGVVLLFVIVMGAYLGLLDAVFSKVIDKIL
jgi:preprotein translocase subunit SecE